MNDPIPTKLHFVWMGTKTIEPKDTKFTDGDGKFRSSTVLANARANPTCEATMWIDLFTMAPIETIKTAIGDELWRTYFGTASLANTMTGPSNLPNPRNAAVFEPIINMLFEVRKRFNAYIQVPANLEKLAKDPACPYGAMLALCRDQNPGPGLKENPIKVRLLDTEVYPRWQAHPPNPEYKLVSWIFFELFVRGSNFGAASDMIRTQLLIDEGGIYVDHDDELVNMHDPTTVRNPPGPPYRGFKHLMYEDKDRLIFDLAINEEMKNIKSDRPLKNRLQNLPATTEQREAFDLAFDRDGHLSIDKDGLVKRELTRYYYVHVATTGYLAAPAHHPFLIFFRDRMLADYAYLLKNDYYWKKPNGDQVMLFEPVTWFDFKRGKSKSTGNWLEFAEFGIQVTGPGQLDKALTFVSDPNNDKKLGGVVYDPLFMLDALETRAVNKYSNAWVTGGAGNAVAPGGVKTG